MNYICHWKALVLGWHRSWQATEWRHRDSRLGDGTEATFVTQKGPGKNDFCQDRHPIIQHSTGVMSPISMFFFRQKKSPSFLKIGMIGYPNCCVTHVETQGSRVNPKWAQEPLDGTHDIPACGHARSRKSADGMMFGGFFLPSAVFWLPGEAHPLNYEVTGWGFVMFSFPSQNVVWLLAKCVLSRSRRPLMP